jgi:hypothetical protein
LRERALNLQLHFDAASQVEKVATKCLKKGDWLLDHMEEEVPLCGARIFAGNRRCAAQRRACKRRVLHAELYVTP